MANAGIGMRIALVLCLASGTTSPASAHISERPAAHQQSHATTSVQAQPTHHPLDPLTGDEIVAAAETLRACGRVSADSNFSEISLNEPPKEEVWSYGKGSSIPREAFLAVFDRKRNKLLEAVVDVGAKTVRCWKEIADAQPGLMAADLTLLDQTVRSDARWQEAMRKRGITDLPSVHIDAWPAGHFGF